MIDWYRHGDGGKNAPTSGEKGPFFGALVRRKRPFIEAGHEMWIVIFSHGDLFRTKPILKRSLQKNRNVVIWIILWNVETSTNEGENEQLLDVFKQLQWRYEQPMTGGSSTDTMLVVNRKLMEHQTTKWGNCRLRTENLLFSKKKPTSHEMWHAFLVSWSSASNQSVIEMNLVTKGTRWYVFFCETSRWQQEKSKITCRSCLNGCIDVTSNRWRYKQPRIRGSCMTMMTVWKERCVEGETTKRDKCRLRSDIENK